MQEQYTFNIIVENTVADNYISEKILDSFLTLTIPVYLGSPKVKDWIPQNCFIDIRDFDEFDDVINYLKCMSSEKKISFIDSIKKQRMQIFEEFSTKNNFTKQVYQWYMVNFNKNLCF